MNTTTPRTPYEGRDTITATDPRLVSAGGAGRFVPPAPRVVTLSLVGLAAVVALFATTLLVLFVASISPSGVGGVPVVLGGALLLVAAPTIVWEFGVAALDGTSLSPSRSRW